MKLLGIFDLFFIQDFYGENGTDWIAIIVGAIFSALVAWFTVYLTIRYQISTKNEEHLKEIFNQRISFIEITHNINSAYSKIIRLMKRAENRFMFGSNSPILINTFNTVYYDFINQISFKDLLELISDLKLSNEEKKKIINYKAKISSIKIDLDNYTINLTKSAEELDNIRKQVDSIILSAISPLQSLLFSMDGFKYKIGQSKIAPWHIVVINSQDAMKINFMRDLDELFKNYQSAVKIKNLRIIQKEFLKSVLKLSRKKQYKKLLDVNKVQSFINCLSMIEKEKKAYKAIKELIKDTIKSLNNSQEIVFEVSRLVKNKHQKNAKKIVKKNTTNWFSKQ